MTVDWIAQARTEFRTLRAQAERALTQADDEAFFRTPDTESNSLALIVKHVGGNLRSRWTEPLTTDGEKPDRDRDGEFEIRHGDTREALMAGWDAGFAAVDTALGAMASEDLSRASRHSRADAHGTGGGVPLPDPHGDSHRTDRLARRST